MKVTLPGKIIVGNLRLFWNVPSVKALKNNEEARLCLTIYSLLHFHRGLLMTTG